MPRTMQHPVPAQLLAHIGDITVSFALLESVLQSLAHSLVGAGGSIGPIITAELSFRNLRALVASLHLKRSENEAEVEQLRGLLKRADALEQVRNKITHSTWVASRTKRSIVRTKRTAKEKQGLRHQFDEMSDVQLATVAQELKVLSSDIEVFYIEFDQARQARGAS